MATNVRLTVSLPPAQARLARRHARSLGVKLSAWVGELVEGGLAVPRPKPVKSPRSQATPLTDACVGVIKLAAPDRHRSDRELLATALAAKHLLR